MKTKELFVSTATKSLVGTLRSIGDVTQNIAIECWVLGIEYWG